MREDKSIDNIKLARTLVMAAQKKGVTQAQIARKIGINQSQVSRIFSGKFIRRSQSVNALCTLFSVVPMPEKSDVSLSNYPDLSFCLAEILDGSRRRERAIVRLLQSARKLS